MLERRGRTGITPAKLWCWFFIYAGVVALLVQLVLLPFVFPAWHAGHGLLAGGDWVTFHNIAVKMADEIHAHGWSAWRLRPEGEAPAGIAAAFYAMTVPEPWVLIPLNAALQATGTLTLVMIVRRLNASWKWSILSVLPFLLYPSAMAWYTQILKDSWSIPGSLLFVYGWMRLSTPDWQRGGWTPRLSAVALVWTGALLMWVVRPYSGLILVGAGAVIALLITAAAIGPFARSPNSRRGLVIGVAMAWLVVASLIPLTVHADNQVGTGAALETVTDPWVQASYLPHIADRLLHSMALARRQALLEAPEARSNIDSGVDFHNAWDFIGYVPRATQIALLAPFPTEWIASGSAGSTGMMRRSSALEMAGVYLCLLGLPFTLWRWRHHLELWVAVLYSTSMLIAYALVIPNMGTLYRMRYSYLMLLVALGAFGWSTVYDQRRLKKELPRKYEVAS